MSIFERDHNNQPNEYAMIKEYRRSGADQEEPAPEDLRTIQALEHTLIYLVRNVMDDARSTTNELALEWYDFLWDRLRAIRKDITQQNICDPNSATLVERCARFHVHSCYAMNRIKDFDVDMNKRNLNDCLQMLRVMYQDLRTTTGHVCEGELEFQKYDILLHLNEDHLSSLVLMKYSEYRSSSEMRFITKVFNAYTNNDYYKFFQLMRQADYMTSCVLSLYANKMRLVGLKTITNACATRQAVLYPADLAISTLGFDDDDDLRQFAEALQMETQEKDSKLHVNLTRDVLTLLRGSETQIPPFKSKRLVEDKMLSKSVGQLVHGKGELPPAPVQPTMTVEESCDEPMEEVREDFTSFNRQQADEYMTPAMMSTPKRSFQEERGFSRDFHARKELQAPVVQPIRAAEMMTEMEFDTYHPTWQFINEVDPTNHIAPRRESVQTAIDEREHCRRSSSSSRKTSSVVIHADTKTPERVSQEDRNGIEPEVEIDSDSDKESDSDSADGNRSDVGSENGFEDASEPEGQVVQSNEVELTDDADDEVEDTLLARVLRKRQERLDRKQVADSMPAGYFKVRSLATSQPTLRLPPKIPGEEELTPTRRFKPVTSPQKKLASINRSIEDEKEANKIFAQLTQVLTQER